MARHAPIAADNSANSPVETGLTNQRVIEEEKRKLIELPPSYLGPSPHRGPRQKVSKQAHIGVKRLAQCKMALFGKCAEFVKIRKREE